MNYFPGYGEVNVRVYIDGWHKQVMQLYSNVVWEPTLEVYCMISARLIAKSQPLYNFARIDNGE